MKLKKIEEDHYVIVDHSEIKEGDWVLTEENTIHQVDYVDAYTKINGWMKITHSTQPLEDFIDNEGIKRIGWTNIKVLELSEVKKLLGVVDVEKKAEEFADSEYVNNSYKLSESYPSVITECYTKGYNQALEDNKDKKYTDTDLFKILLDFIEFQHPHHEPRGSIIERFVKTRQPKTEWEVDFFDGKLGFKK